MRSAQLLHPFGPPPGAHRDKQSYLETNSVNPPTLEAYRRSVLFFLQRENFTNLNCAAEELDAHLVTHFDRLFLEGKGFNAGQKLLAALMFFLPVYSPTGW